MSNLRPLTELQNYSLVFTAKRCELYKEFVEFTDSDNLKLLRSCSTRWLSLLTCIQRVLNQWDALQDCYSRLHSADVSTIYYGMSPLHFFAIYCHPLSLFLYFDSHEEAERNAKVRDLARLLSDPVMKTYFVSERCP